MQGSWDFYTKNTTLNWLTIWLLFAPNALLLLQDIVIHEPWMLPGRTGLTSREITLILLSAIAFIAMQCMLVWGSASILVIGKRQIQNKAGRARTSFSAVRNEAKALILPLLFTGILQGINIVYYSLLFIIPALLLSTLSESNTFIRHGMHLLMLSPLLLPAIVYGIRTMFYDVIIATGGQPYRESLKQSKELIHGHTWRTFGVLIMFCVVAFFPSAIVSLVIELFQNPTPSKAYIFATDMLRTLIASFGSLFFILFSIQYVGALRACKEGSEIKAPRATKKPVRKKATTKKSSREVVPPPVNR